jgi:PAS domain S-box-containing protein
VAGLALFALMRKTLWPVRIYAVILGFLGGLTLLELLGGIALNINFWFIEKQTVDFSNGGLMSPTTATCFFLAGLSLLLLSFSKNIYIIPAVFLNLIILTITLIALLGHGIGIVPAFVWLGIKMAPHTAIGLSLFSLAIITLIAQTAIDAFNRLNFFKRIATGFGFMAILVIAIGSIAFMQIHTVSNITHKLYTDPLQINNAAMRIKAEINSINRQLKNIAIQPSIFSEHNILEELNLAEQRIHQDLNFIRSREPKLNPETNKIALGFSEWKQYVIESCELLQQKEFERYSLRTVYVGQEKILAIDNLLDNVSLQAQQHIAELNTTVSNTETEAKKLVSVIVFGFLLVGISVATLITRSLTCQLQLIRRTMLAMTDEQLTHPIPFLNHTQEIGDIARALEVFQESMSARRELETRLLQVIETMPNGIIMVNSSGIIEIVNAQAEKIFGYERNELLGKLVEQLIPQHAAKSHSHNRDSFFANPSPRIMGTGRELFGLRRDGQEFPLEIGLAPVNTKDGMKVLASIVDITERRNASIALNESRERLELTTRINQIGVWEYIVDSGKLIWSDTMFDIYGRKKDFFTADYSAWKQCLHPDDIANAEKLFKESIEKFIPYLCKFRIIQPDGTIKYIQAKAKIDRQANNQLRILGTNIDITREELAVEKLHSLEVLRSAIVEFSEDAIISKTPQGVITSWNSGACNMFGYSAEEAIGKPITELLFPPTLKHQEDMLLAQVRAGMIIKHFETVRLCKDGRMLNVSITLSPIKDTAGNTVGISAIKRDITDTIKTAKILSQRKLELERSNKELETFAYVASHDLKSPLRGIAQLSTWIEEDLASNEYSAVMGHTELLRNRIQRMEKLLDDLLIFYRAGKSEGTLMTVNVNQMINEIFEIQNNKPGLHLELLNELPTLTTLSTPLELIIRNLLSNAIKHHDQQEGVIQVRSRELNDDFFEFSVSDDGPGIPEKFHHRIFGMFQTLKPRDELEGSGMGLALIKKIIDTYGCTVTLKSEGRGACFSFSWPKNMRRREEHD